MALHIVKDAKLFWETAPNAPADAGFLHTISNEATLSLTADAPDVTTMGSDWRGFLAGLRTGVLSLSGYLPADDDYLRTVEQAWTGLGAERWVVLEPSEIAGSLPIFALKTRSMSIDIGENVGEAVTFGMAMNATDKLWRATRMHSSDARPSGAQAWAVPSSVFGSGATRAAEAYIIFLLKGPNLASGRSLTASWNTSPATSLTGIFRPIVSGSAGAATERMTIKKVPVKASGGMILSIQANNITTNLATGNGLNAYVVPT